MASEEQESSNPQFVAPATNPNSAPVPATTLPEYPEMILSAIEALNEKEGSNKTSISKHIESIYGDLHPAHSTLVTHHLNLMKSSGQLLFVKNNYLKPDPNAPPPPPRRGRGRPPKPKTPLPPGVVPLPARPRGRPPKAMDPDAPLSPPKPKATYSTASLSGKKRGRPPKASTGEDAPPHPPPPSDGEVRRGRGRPPKAKAVVAAPVGA